MKLRLMFIQNYSGGQIPLLWFIIPMFSLACMFLVGCDATDEPTLQTNAPLSAKDPGQRPFSDKAAAKNSHTQIIRPKNDDRPRIVAFGNSLTAGLGVPPEESYPARLQRRLDEAGYPFRVINAGVSGDTTAGALRRLNWILKSQPSIVIIELGANDGLRGQPVKNMYENLRQIIQRLKDAKVQIVLTGMKIPPNYGLDYTSQFSGMYTRLADEYRLTFMPFFLEGVAAHRSLNQADGIHPTGEGYKVIVNNLLTVLEPLLKSSTPPPVL